MADLRIGRFGRTQAMRAAISTLVGLALVTALIPPGPRTAGAASGSRGAPYVDLAGHWARPEIEALWARQALDPSETRFRPDDKITRGEFVVILAKALGYAGEAAEMGAVVPPFSDVPAGGALAGFASVALENDLVRGYPDGTFRPGQSITRDEISALLVRVLGLEPETTGPSGLPFTDRAAVSPWAAGYVATAYTRGLVRGYRDGAFRPRGETTRAEAASLIARALGLCGRLYDLGGILRGASDDGSLLAVDLWPSGLAGAGAGSALAVGASPGPTVYLTVPPEAVVFRNGAAAEPHDILPLDEVSFILDSRGQVAYAQATRLDGMGVITAVAPDLSSLTLAPAADGSVSGSAAPGGSGGPASGRTLALEPWAPIFAGGREVTGAARSSGLAPGQDVYFILGSLSGSVRAVAVLDAEVGPASLAGLRRAELDEPDSNQLSFPSPAEASALARAAVGLPALGARLAAGGRGTGGGQGATDGRGQIIAVIDTGVDVAHPDLAMASTLERKVIDWVDFSGEGDVRTDRISIPVKGLVETDLGQAYVGSITTKSGFLHSGVLEEDHLDSGSPLGQDLDRNQSTTDSFLVVVADRRMTGFYDTVYVDTDRDLDLTDEIPLRPYRDSGLVSWFGSQDRDKAALCSFVLADVRADGNQVTLGFDGNGHGTHVAAIASAYGSYRGGFDGLAPGAKILAIKALGSSGDGSWAAITRAVTYAAQQGASIATLSVANLSNQEDLADETAAISAVLEKSGMLLVVAAGNDGPGLDTARGLGGGPNILTVGASVTKDMWQSYYGYDVPDDTIWPFSSAGPNGPSVYGPDVVAPGCALSAAPRWLEAPGYAMSEGTSMAAPHAAGVAAVLWHEAKALGRTVTGSLVREAIIKGAKALPGYSLLEQGFGEVDADRAWAWLATAPAGPSGVRVSTSFGDGFYRDAVPARLSFAARSRADGVAWVDLSTTAPWLGSEKRKLALPAGVTRSLGVTVAGGLSPGLYAGCVNGTSGRETLLSIPVAFVVPMEFDRSTWKVSSEGSLGPGRLARQFFRVPPGAGRLTVTFGVPVTGEAGFAGRIRGYLYRPDGSLAGTTPYVGEGTDSEAGFAAISVDEPTGGVWEAVVYGSAAITVFDLPASQYWLEGALGGIVYDLPSDGLGLTLPTATPAVPPAAIVSAITRTWRPIPGSGATSTDSVRVSIPWINAQPAFQGELFGYGLWTGATGMAREAGRIRPGETWTGSLPERIGGSGLLRVSLRVTGTAEGSPEPDLDLYLYRREVDGWAECAASAEPGVANETVELASPSAGEYVVYVESALGPGGPATFEVASQWLPEGRDVTPSPAEVVFGAGASGALSLNVLVPPGEGIYRGVLRVVDRTGALDLEKGAGATVSVVPITIRRSGRATSLLCLTSKLLPGENLLTFRVRAESGAAVEHFSLEFGGRVYQADRGSVTVPYEAGGNAAGSVELRASLVEEDGTRTSWTFSLSAGDVAASGTARDSIGLGVWRPAWMADEGYCPASLEKTRNVLSEALWGGLGG